MSSLVGPSAPSGETIGAGVLALALKHAGCTAVFGVVGIPIIEVGGACQLVGLQYVGFRNEQAASYAAGAASYLSGVPQACLVVSGPGVVHGVAGLANAWANCWPMILIGGASSTMTGGMGAFQESPTMDACRPFTKYQARVDSVARIPFLVARAMHIARSGRPGPVYLEIPAEFVTASIPTQDIPALLGKPLPPPPRPLAEPQSVTDAITLLRGAQRPLVIVGKGCAWSRAETQVRAFVQQLNIPFLATPMGKGVVADDHPLSVAAARSAALAGADVVLLLGARLNWMLHFGLSPRFSESVKIIQADISPEELHTNVRTEVALVGDLQSVVGQLLSASQSVSFPSWSAWKAALAKDVEKNNASVARLMANESVPMSYYRVFKAIQAGIPKDSIIVSEGANTMDIGRSILLNHSARHRLDAGSFGTMGVGLGFAIAAALHCQSHAPNKRVICVEGDSAFGFSGMEFEVAARYKLPIVFIVVNNSGIYQGLESSTLPEDRFSPAMPVTQLSLGARYDKLAEVVGDDAGRGFLARTPHELEAALAEALKLRVPTIINVIIRNQQERKQQPHSWLTNADKKVAKSKL